MNIVNEIDPENPKNNRTIDLDIGVYLKISSKNPIDNIIIFSIMYYEVYIGIYTYIS